MSTDHEWGPRVELYVGEQAPQDLATHIDRVLRETLPTTFRGYSTNFGPPDPADHGTRVAVPAASGPINHKISVQTPAWFFNQYLGIDVSQELGAADWLTIPQQKLRTIASGAVFHDEIGLEATRRRFAQYPNDVWLYLLAAGWTRIGQEEHLMGRAGFVGDETGSAIIAARLVRDVMRLAFLVERVYAPYPKWFGTAFRELRCAASLAPHVQRTLDASTWQERERGLVGAYEIIASMHNALEITEPIEGTVRAFFGRPFRVIALNGFADAIVRVIHDPVMKRICDRPLIGGIDQVSDNTDLLENPVFRNALRRLYSS